MFTFHQKLIYGVGCWMIVWYNAQGDKMPKYDKMPKVKMPKWHFAQVWQNAQGDKMPKRHYAQDDKMPKMSFCPKWQNAILHSTRVQPSDDTIFYLRPGRMLGIYFWESKVGKADLPLKNWKNEIF